MRSDFLDDLRVDAMNTAARPEWDQIWMEFAHTISKRSVDPRLRVGAVIATQDNTQVLSIGYNGDQKGGPNATDSQSPGESGFLHAEINALIKCDFNNFKKKKLYLTDSPCKICAKAIINGNIDEVVYDRQYRDLQGLDILRSSGVHVRRFIFSNHE
jgi:dCMP deaminase